MDGFPAPSASGRSSIRAVKKTFFLALLLIGCGDSNGNPDLSGIPDLSGGVDMARDLAVMPCDKMVGTWPGVKAYGFYDPDYLQAGAAATVAFSQESAANPWNELSIEAWHTRTFPGSATFKTTDNYANCDICVVYGEQCDSMGCNVYFFALGGSGNVMQADENESAGRMRATASNLRLVEWDFQN